MYKRQGLTLHALSTSASSVQVYVYLWPYDDPAAFVNRQDKIWYKAFEATFHGNKSRLNAFFPEVAVQLPAGQQYWMVCVHVRSMTCIAVLHSLSVGELSIIPRALPSSSWIVCLFFRKDFSRGYQEKN